MSDIYGRTTDQYGGSFTPDGLLVNFTGGGTDLVAAGLVVQSVGWNSAQRASLLFEIGSPRVYFVGGRTEGQVSLQRVVGPSSLGAAFITRFGNICNVDQNSLSISSANGFCSGGGGQSNQENYTLQFCLITNLGYNVNANDSLMMQTIQMMFTSCKMQ